MFLQASVCPTGGMRCYTKCIIEESTAPPSPLVNTSLPPPWTTPPSPPLGRGHNTFLPPGPGHNTSPPPWTTPPFPWTTPPSPPGTRSQHLPPPGTRSQHLPPSPSPRNQVTTPHSLPWDQVTTSPSPLGPGHNSSLPPPPDYAQVGGTHPTGMHSCYNE